jgi:hypothetical protein
MRARAAFATLLACATAFNASAQVPTPKALGPELTPPNYNNPSEKGLHFFAPFLHWDLREFPGCTVPWASSPNPVPDLNKNGNPNDAMDRSSAVAAFQAGFNAWDAVTPALINFANTGLAPAPAGFRRDNYNTIGWGSGTQDDSQIIPFGVAIPPGTPVVGPGANGVLETQPGGDDIVVGFLVIEGGNGLCETNSNTWDQLGMLYGLTGCFYNNQSGVLIEVDIVLRGTSPDFDWVITNAPNDVFGDINLRGVATHEIGHMLGIAHPFYPLPANPDAADGISPTMTGALFPIFDMNAFNLTLEDEDWDSCNFLYCPDLGDAPDPCVGGGTFNVFPTLVHEPAAGRTLNGLTLDKRALGAQHVFGIRERQVNRNWTYEWLAKLPGTGATTECEANITDVDPLDDGVSWMPNPPVWGRKMRVKQHMRYATDDASQQHNYAARPLYANGWLDTNQNCIWEEHFMSVPKQPAMLAGRNVSSFTAAFGAVQLPAVVNADFPVWLRCRLDYGENVGQAMNIDGTLDLEKGAAQFGEVEDYKFYCTTRYDKQILCNPFPFPMFGVVMVYIGPANVLDAIVSRPSTESGEPTGTAPPPSTTYNGILDESDVYCPAGVVLIPPGTYFKTAKCRPNPLAQTTRSLSMLPPEPPQTKARSYFTTDTVGPSTPAADVPLELRIPTVNCATSYLPGVESPGTVTVTVGAVDFENGGWINGPDTLTGEWEDTLRVTVAYRVSPQLIPIEDLYPAHPVYGALPLVPVGQGLVTPEEAFEFTLDVPTDLPLGSYLILEVESSWSTNIIVNRELIEFDTAVGTPTGVDAPSVPKVLSLENRPNPFNPATIVRYSLPKAADVDLRVYDVAGRLVRTLVRGARQPAGTFEVEWDGRNQRGLASSSGIYFLVLKADDEMRTHKVVLLK